MTVQIKRKTDGSVARPGTGVYGEPSTDGEGNLYITDFSGNVVQIAQRGSFLTVADDTARDAIPANDRREGMIVSVASSASNSNLPTVYRLEGGITNVDWVSYSTLQGVYNTGAGSIKLSASKPFQINDDSSNLVAKLAHDLTIAGAPSSRGFVLGDHTGAEFVSFGEANLGGGNYVAGFSMQQVGLGIVLNITDLSGNSIATLNNFDGIILGDLDGGTDTAQAKRIAVYDGANDRFAVDGTTGNVTTVGFYRQSVESGITADTTQTQMAAYLLSKQISEVSTVANDGDAVKLPAAVVGDTFFVTNNGANSLQIFPNHPQDLGNGPDTSITIPVGAAIKFTCYATDTLSSTLYTSTNLRTASAADYVMNGGENIVAITDTSVGRTVTLPDNPIVGQTYGIKDESGGAGASPITIATPGAETIDGAGSVSINANYGSVAVYSDGTNWFTV